MLFLDDESDSCRFRYRCEPLIVTLFWSFRDQSAFGFKSQGTKKIERFSQGTDDSIYLRYEGLITVNYKCKEFPVLLSQM